MKYAVVVSGIMALLIAGCGTDDNGEGRNNIGRSTSNVNERVGDNVANVNDNSNNGARVNNLDTRQLSNAHLRTSEEAAERVENIKNVKHATVIITDNNAYVGAVLEEGTKLTESLEENIASAVKQGNKKAERVFISTNPDFTRRMDGYVNDLNNDRPVRGLADEFGETVRRVFPDAR